MLTQIFKPLVQFQIAMRNAVLRFIGRAITAADRLVYSWTKSYQHLELDLLGPCPEGVGRWNPSGLFGRLSFPHMLATALVWIDIMVAMSLLPTSERLAQTLYALAPLLYVSLFIAAVSVRRRLGGHPARPWVIGGAKITGLGFAAFTFFIAGMVILPFAVILAVLWLIAAVLCIVFVPGLGWEIVKADVQWLWSLVTPRRVNA